MSQTPSSWRGSGPYARRHEPAQPVGGDLRREPIRDLHGLPRPAVSGWRVLREALYWVLIIVLGGYAIFAPLLPEPAVLW